MPSFVTARRQEWAQAKPEQTRAPEVCRGRLNARALVTEPAAVIPSRQRARRLSRNLSRQGEWRGSLSIVTALVVGRLAKRLLASRPRRQRPARQLIPAYPRPNWTKPGFDGGVEVGGSAGQALVVNINWRGGFRLRRAVTLPCCCTPSTTRQPSTAS